MPRGDQAWRIRALGPRFHAMAEAHLTSWQNWVTTNNKTWVDAGKEFRRRMVVTGYDVSLGDTWAMNEVPSSVRQNAGQSRRNLLDFLKGLYEGDGSAAPTKGLVFVVGLGQRTQNLSVYLGNMRGWLSDSAFWSTADAYVRFWAQEVYGDVRAWGVADAPRMTRSRHLIEYVMHPLNLARAGGEQTAVAEAFLRRTYLPLANAAWKWRSGFGFTDVDHLVMRHFLSEQVHAIRHDAGTHPAEGPSGRVGFAWAPENVPSEPDFPAKTAGLQQRLASAFANAYAQGGSSQMGPAGRPATTSGARASSKEPRSTRGGAPSRPGSEHGQGRVASAAPRRRSSAAGLAGAAAEDQAAEGEAEAERADREGADRDALAPHRHLLPATDRVALLVGQLLPAPLLAPRAACLQAEVEVVEDLGAVGHAPSV